MNHRHHENFIFRNIPPMFAGACPKSTCASPSGMNTSPEAFRRNCRTASFPDV
jgi:hypothetical protein